MFSHPIRRNVKRSIGYLLFVLAIISSSINGSAAGGGAVSDTQTYCFGRFLIDLPKTAELISQTSGFMFGEIETGRTPPKENMYQDGFVEMMKTREAELRAVTKDGKYSYADTRLTGEPKARILVTSRTAFGSKAYGFEAYRSNGGVLFSMKVNAVGAEGIDSVLKDLETRLLPNLRARKPNEIPSEPGLCIEKGFIADDGQTPQYEKAELYFKFKEWPDVTATVRATRGGSKLKPSLLERRSKVKIPALFAEAAKEVKSLRKGKHDVGSLRGEEILEAYPTDGGYFTHRFVWDTQGKLDSATEPAFYFELQTGVAGPRDVRPSLTDQQAIKLFDTIVKSIRLRPTTPGKTSDASDPNQPSPATPKRLPLKSKVASSSNCPQTGIWECAADAPGITEHRRFIEAGQPMPYGIAQQPSKRLGGLLGQQEDETVEISWALVAYEHDVAT